MGYFQGICAHVLTDYLPFSHCEGSFMKGMRKSSFSQRTYMPCPIAFSLLGTSKNLNNTWFF